jgi:tRNA-splicing ligase RtcB
MKSITPKLMNWASLLDDNALEQAKETSTMPFVYPHLALMPDAHLGMGSTVGSVVPTEGAIMPACIGVDIGCGMMAVKTQFKKEQFIGKPLAKLREQIERAIPLSAGSYNGKVVKTAEPRIKELEDLAGVSYDGMVKTNWRLHLGTLGSGNHFIEISHDEDNNVWLFLHSGSRGIGNKIAMTHIQIAQDYAKRHFMQLPNQDLAFFIEGTKEFNNYIRDMKWAQRFAYLNREEMMERVVRQVSDFMGTDVEKLQEVNCHHNFTQQEKHWGKDLWITRKGAISADKGKLGLIPGSMGTDSYVVEGLGYAPSFNSAPHGAGRVYSRSAARKEFTEEQLEKSMEGIEYRKSDAFIDEIPSAYKDINVVIDDARDLVRVVHKLNQIINVKGD